MDDDIDIKPRVVAELRRREGSLREVATVSGLAYDTVLRIKNGEGDPGYSKVIRLARLLLGQSAPAGPTDAPSPQINEPAAPTPGSALVRSASGAVGSPRTERRAA